MNSKQRVKKVEQALKPVHSTANVYCFYETYTDEPELKPEEIQVVVWADTERSEMTLAEFRNLFPDALAVHVSKVRGEIA